MFVSWCIFLVFFVIEFVKYYLIWFDTNHFGTPIADSRPIYGIKDPRLAHSSTFSFPVQWPGTQYRLKQFLSTGIVSSTQHSQTSHLDATFRFVNALSAVRLVCETTHQHISMWNQVSVPSTLLVCF